MEYPDPVLECEGDWGKVSKFVMAEPNRSVIANMHSGKWIAISGANGIVATACSLESLKRRTQPENLDYILKAIGGSRSNSITAYLKIKPHGGEGNDNGKV